MGNKKKLLEQLIQSPQVLKVLEYLEVIQLLLLKYGKKLQFPNFLSLLEEFDSDLAHLIKLLKTHRLLHSNQLSVFIRSLRDALPTSSQSFTIKSNTHKVLKSVENTLQKKFGKKVNLVFEAWNAEKIGIKIKGQGMVFKRSLDQDIEKLLA